MGSAYILVVLGIVLAKGLGFFRDIAFSGVFATGVEADIYFQVFNIVNLIFAGVGVALSTLVIKNLNKAENIGKEKGYVASFLRKSTAAMCGVAIAIALFSEPIVKYLLLPGLDQKHLSLAVLLMRIMAPSLVFVVIAYIISGVLQNEKVFFITSVMSLPFNVVIIASLLFPNVSLITVSAVTTLGWFLHIAILLPSFIKKGYGFTRKYKPSLSNGKNPEVAWIFISNMMYQLVFYTDRAFVSYSEGLASTFSYASNLFVIIASIFVVAMSTVFFPSISKNYEEGNVGYVNETLQYIITVMCAIFLPFLLVVGVFGNDLIRLVYERGEFTHETTISVSVIFFVYSLGVLGYVAQELFNKFLYLAGKYRVCVIGTVGIIASNIIANLLIDRFSPDGNFLNTSLPTKALLIALSSSALLFVYSAIISVSIKGVVGSYWKKPLLADLLKILVCGVLSLGVYVAFNTAVPAFTHGKLTFVIPLCICGIFYIVPLYFSGVLMKLIKKKGTKQNEN